ncbi:hypothetical protein SDRG_13747 [Saprolegnia diclina VS20]|uniref:Polycystin cation channel PKD1/PKD2 domain-containing protein n=1 Tax=Saprolegnia diclina (strain VS20) TaxID=1156394 RepID=T0PSF7_SAPDV|nr:hypothetical protein SDRG_13747 [Saprolegnia diclina VS20]EQC28419.1 hypothetical protein SDRG_13747 [Saprolegnia diclina VS20]|eukprot:XP_008618067.1 hypothetical protein SDRG_13747 [Saprolegnia diclina VS20]
MRRPSTAKPAPTTAKPATMKYERTSRPATKSGEQRKQTSAGAATAKAFAIKTLLGYIEANDFQRAWDELDKCKLPDQKATTQEKKKRGEAESVVLYSDSICELYGNEAGELRKSILFKLLREPEMKGLLEHDAMALMLHLKWKHFGNKMYIQQCLLYLLLLLTLTLSVSMDLDNGPTPEFHGQLLLCLHGSVALGLGFGATFLLTPDTNRKQWGLATFGVIAIVDVALWFVSELIASHTDWIWFVRINNLLLSTVASYFIWFEVLELYGEVNENATKNGGFCVALEALVDYFKSFVDKPASHYFESTFNKLQLPLFVAIFIFGFCEVLAPSSGDAELYVSITLTFATWALSIQYLEVHETAGYLIPMMKHMLDDVLKFMAFYVPFLGAYTIAYYLLFQGRNEAAYNTMSHSFVTAFLVLVGQIDADPFEKLPSPGPIVLGYTLLLTHATLVIVLLLNVLIAMMNATMATDMETAQLDAIVSFAECILRSEKTIKLQKLVLPIAESLPAPEDDPTQMGDTDTTSSAATNEISRSDANTDNEQPDVVVTSLETIHDRLLAIEKHAATISALEKENAELKEMLRRLDAFLNLHKT